MIVRGDERAFLTLYDRFASHVYSLTLRILGDLMLAEEVTQDNFLKLCSCAVQFIPNRGELISWLLAIAHRTALDRLRSENRRVPASNAHDPQETWSVLPDENTMDTDARWRSLHFAVQALSVEQRQVIDLAYYKGMSSVRSQTCWAGPSGQSRPVYAQPCKTCVNSGWENSNE